jgi:hypothetical protein
VLGRRVADITATVRELAARGVEFRRYDGMATSCPSPSPANRWLDGGSGLALAAATASRWLSADPSAKA